MRSWARALCLFGLPLVGCAAGVPQPEHEAALSDQRSRYEGILRKARAETEQLAERQAAALRAIQRRQRTAQARLESCERERLAHPARRRRAPRAGALAALFQAELKAGAAQLSDPRTIRFDAGQWFVADASGLSAAGQARLQRLAAQAQRAGWALAVGVYSPPVTPAAGESGWSLCADRAIVFIQALTEAGVDPAQLSAELFGRYRPEAGATPGRQVGLRLRLR